MNIDPTLNAIRVVNNWPKNGGHVIEGKVPSVYTYSGNSDTLWGYGIGHDSYRIRLSKLGLQTPKLEDALIALERTLNEAGYLSTTTEVLQNYQFPRHLTKSPVDVTTDYLTAVAEVVWDDIVNASGGTQINLTTWPIDFVITYPAAWNQRAISRIFQAATTAFERKFQPGKVTLGSIRLATESEACAQYTIRSVHEGKQLALNAVSWPSPYCRRISDKSVDSANICNRGKAWSLLTPEVGPQYANAHSERAIGFFS